MSVAIKTVPKPILPRIRAAGGDAILRGGSLVVASASRVDLALIEEAKARRDDLIAEIEADIGATDQAHGAAERAAIIGEASGNPQAFAPHKLPPSWPAPEYEPTVGAICTGCSGNAWWAEASAPKGWRCARCYPGDHLPADRRRDVMT
jgi:hypothetical protein